MYHSFNTEIAKKYGVVEAILLNYFAFWLTKNKANNQHLHDGRYWTYNSIKAFAKMFDYLTEKQLRRVLGKLKAEGLIVTGNYNSNPYDRSLWYALTDKAMKLIGIDLKPENADTEKENSISENGKINLPKKANRFEQKGEPIPVNIQLNKQINTSSSSNNIYNNARTTEPCVSATATARDTNVLNNAHEAIVFWMNNTGQAGEVIRSDIAELVGKHGNAFVIEAMREAIRSNVRKIKYVRAILERMASGEDKKQEASSCGIWEQALKEVSKQWQPSPKEI
jgi:DNA-binding HxlR family transcriptional regulator